MAKTDKQSRSQGQEIYLRIVSEIRQGRLNPGARLTETELAARFGISRTPVREAIRQLETDGLLEHTPRLGVTIRRLNPHEVSELYDMRAVLEGTAAQFAARAASAVELAEIQAIHETMKDVLDTDRAYEINRQFHSAILGAARNRFLLRAVETVNKTLLILGRSTLEDQERAQAVYKEHGDVLAALEARDPEQAERAMRAHIQQSHRARLRQLRNRPPPEDGGY